MVRISRWPTTLWAAGGTYFAYTAGAAAHALGARYDLPLPLEYYLAAAGATVALSFVMMAIAFDSRSSLAKSIWISSGRLGPLHTLGHPASLTLIKLLSVAVFVLILITGFFGNQDPLRNFSPTFIWITWWVGLAYMAALIGDIWPVINPWAIVHEYVEMFAKRIGLRGPLSLERPYPPWLGAWPAILLFMCFAWFELIDEAAKAPRHLALAILVYSAITWAGMLVFGRSIWLERGECFALAFGIFGRFAPFGSCPDNSEDEAGSDRQSAWGLRAYGSALVTTTPRRLTTTVFIVVILSTVTFDGFKETPFWSDVLQWLAVSPFFHPVLRVIHNLGFDYFVFLETVLLVLFPALFVVVYLSFAWMMKQASKCDKSVGEVAGLFVYSIVPIAIAYHLAHYLSYLLTAGQNIIPLLSDPFGWGWNLFGTADYKTNIGLVGAKFVWYTSVIAIVLGHVIAVAVAHFVALRIFDSTKVALRSQYPLLVLMVGYTMVSLWILSQPIVGSPSLSTLDARSNTVTMAPYEFRELCVALKDKQKIDVQFESSEPIDYDIHYHDGFSIRFPIKQTNVRDYRTEFRANGNRAYCLMWFNGGLKETSLRYRVTGP